MLQALNRQQHTPCPACPKARARDSRPPCSEWWARHSTQACPNGDVTTRWLRYTLVEELLLAQMEESLHFSLPMDYSNQLYSTPETTYRGLIMPLTKERFTKALLKRVKDRDLKEMSDEYSTQLVWVLKNPAQNMGARWLPVHFDKTLIYWHEVQHYY